jgi:hypothetical protein
VAPGGAPHPVEQRRQAGLGPASGWRLDELSLQPYLPQIALAGWAAVLVWRLPETRRPGQPDGGGRRFRLAGLSEPRFLRVVLPLAPWVFGSAAIAMVYAPGLVAGRVDGPAVFLGALVALCTAMSGVLIQPVARWLARPGRPSLLVTSMALVTVGMAAEAGWPTWAGLSWCCLQRWSWAAVMAAAWSMAWPRCSG